MALNQETDYEMQSRSYANVMDNGDDSLHKLYEEHCLFSIPEDEVTRIQHAVEIMVRFLLLSMYESTSFSELIGFDKSIKLTLASFKTPPNIPYAFDNQNLLKVGSFYENTKNHYPEEFDFIFVIAESMESEYGKTKTLLSSMADIFHKCLKKTVKEPFLAGTCIEFVKYVRLHGPAATLEFRYKIPSAEGDKTSIFVDISPASRLFIQNNAPSEMLDTILYPEWKKRVQATGSFLFLKVFRAGHPKRETKIKLSITESEQQYILKEMSEKHKRVYRILKYLLNNYSKGEHLRELMRSDENRTNAVGFRVFYPRVVYDFPSYVIKTLMFHHCHYCNNSTTTISSCVVSVLDDILKQFKSGQWTNIKSRCFSPERSCSVSVETMTGEKLEVADSYKSSLKIKKYLKEVRCDVLNNHVSEQSTLAIKMLPIVRKHQREREARKKAERSKAKCCTCGLIFILTFSFLFIYFMVTVSHVQMRMCLNGTYFIEYMNFTSSVHLNTSNMNRSNIAVMSTFEQGKLTSATAIGNSYCLQYNDISVHEDQVNMTIENVNRIYYCGDRSFCKSENKVYRIKAFKRGFEQQLVCSAIGFESNMLNDYLWSDIIDNENGIENTGRRLACLQKDSACLDITERRYNTFGLLIAETLVGCDEDQNCIQTFPKQVALMGCQISQYLNGNRNATETGVCCCDRHVCQDTEEKEQMVIDIVYYSNFAAAIAIIFLPSVYVCLWIGARLEYSAHFIKRKYREYRLS